jgi:prolyl-tRNA synthetase
MEALTDKFKETLNFSPSSNSKSSSFNAKMVSHSPTTNATWKETLANVATPTDYLLTKTLVFKPKVAKSATAVLIMVVALEDTHTNGTQIAKAAGEKEARLAAADVVKDTLGVTVEQGTILTHVNIVSPLSISKDHSEKVQVLLDSRVVSSTELVAFHPSDETKTVFITVKELQEYLSSTDVKVTEIDFTAVIVPGYDSFVRLMQDCGKSRGKTRDYKTCQGGC